MNKEQLVKEIAVKASLSQKEASQILDALTDTIMETVASGDKLTLVGFGSFEARHRSERSGINPQTKEAITIPATRVPAFAAGKLFKEKVAPEKQQTPAKAETEEKSQSSSKTKSKEKS